VAPFFWFFFGFWSKVCIYFFDIFGRAFVALFFVVGVGLEILNFFSVDYVHVWGKGVEGEDSGWFKGWWVKSPRSRV